VIKLKNNSSYYKVIFYTLIMLLTIITLSACGQSSNPSKNASSNWEIGNGELSDSIGNNSTVKSGAIELIGQGFYHENTDQWQKLGFNTPTGTWFMHNGSGLFGYGLTVGTQAVGAEVTVRLLGHNDNGETLDRDVRIQLTEFVEGIDDRELIIEEIVHVDTVSSEEVIFNSDLPEKENAIYVLSAEIVNDQGEVEDTRISTIYVPKQEMNAALSTDKSVYQKDDKEAMLTLSNYGPTFLMLGKSYSIEKMVNGEWRIVPLNLAFEDIGIILPVGDKYEQIVDLSSLDTGEYRIVKDFHVDGIDLSATLASEFMIE
jgi:hypothetical protein